jgi:hypothetical protein
MADSDVRSLPSDAASVLMLGPDELGEVFLYVDCNSMLAASLICRRFSELRPARSRLSTDVLAM